MIAAATAVKRVVGVPVMVVGRIHDPAEAERILGAAHPRFKPFEAKGSVLVGAVHPSVAEVAAAVDALVHLPATALVVAVAYMAVVGVVQASAGTNRKFQLKGIGNFRLFRA